MSYIKFYYKFNIFSIDTMSDCHYELNLFNAHLVFVSIAQIHRMHVLDISINSYYVIVTIAYYYRLGIANF